MRAKKKKPTATLHNLDIWIQAAASRNLSVLACNGGGGLTLRFMRTWDFLSPAAILQLRTHRASFRPHHRRSHSGLRRHACNVDRATDRIAVVRPPRWAEAMRLFSSLRRPVIRSMIGVLIFAQMALAAYACPNLTKATHAGASMHSQVQDEMPTDANHSIQASPTVEVANAVQSMPVDCDQVDVEAPNLCAEYCKQGQQSADHTPSSTLAPVVLTALYSVMHDTAAPTAEAAYYAPGLLLQAAGPPHAIEHCCLRT